ncbi:MULTISPECIES: AAA family ATPase [unclassified Arthrobacter]|uniref:AAA family ATPase n=1 Tax=unclassified Arthrobacter TaxID=235627 RepID=UPI001C850AE9|nr:AAA family ATPase [Arthrobacter sp. MAHUQ-56]MBX7444688.1 AAA family ATPase [Arthrobacter sp. MAHUQ-56]
MDILSAMEEFNISEDDYQEHQQNSVPVPPPPMSGTRNKVGYGNIAALLAGNLPPAPTPSILRRVDGIGMFYANQVNILFGEPESGKTFVALAAIVECLNKGGRAVFLDMDHNGMEGIAARLLDLGAQPLILGDLDRFRYKEPEDRQDLMEAVADLRAWSPGVAVLDSIGELMPTMGLSSNSPDDFTIAHTSVLKPLAMAGAAVIAIDHVAKNTESKAQGPTGTAAKSRAAGGTMLRVTVKEAFTPGHGGAAYLNVKKDRHGGLRSNSPRGDKEPLGGTFKLFPDGNFAVFAAQDGERMPEAVPAADLAELQALDPPPTTVREARERLSWGNDRATAAMRVFKQQVQK